jgi:hypothetical protein
MILIFAALVPCGWACAPSPPSSPEGGLSADALRRARARWEASAPRSYNLEWSARGVEPAGHYLVAVRDGIMARAHRVEPDGREVAIDGPAAEALRVEGLFAMLERQGAGGSTRFDPTLGFPTTYRKGSSRLDVLRLDTSPRLVKPIDPSTSKSASTSFSSPGAAPP